MQLHSLTPFTGAAPGETVTLRWRAENRGDATRRLLPHLELPEGWQAIWPPEPVTLPPGDSYLLSVMVRIPPGELAGEYSTALRLQGPGPPARVESATVRVRMTGDLEVILLSAPAYVQASSYTAAFAVRNASHAPQELKFRAEENLGFDAKVQPQSARLVPGASVVVTVVVQAPADLAHSVAHRLLLTAQSERHEGGPVERPLAAAVVEIRPRALPDDAGYHTLPLELTVLTEGAGSAGTAAGTAVSWELTGSGALWETDPGRLVLRLDDERRYGAYLRPDLSIAGGDQSFSLSPLTDPGTPASGGELRWTDGPLGWQVYGYTIDPDLNRTGVRSEYRLGRSDVSLQLFNRSELPGDIWSVQGRFSPAPPWRFEVEYGLRADRAADLPPRAWRFSNHLTAGSFVTQASWEQTEGGFRTDRESRRLSAASSTPLSGSTRLGVRTENLMEYVKGGAPYLPTQNAWKAVATVNGDSAAGGWWLQYTYADEWAAAPPVNRWDQSVDLFLRHPLEGGAVLYQNVGWVIGRDRALSKLSSAARYGLSYDAGSNRGGLEPYLEAEFPLLSPAGIPVAERLSLGIRAFRKIHDRLTLVAGGEAADLLGEKYSAFADARYTLPAAGVLTLGAEQAWAKGADPSLTARAAYTIPLDVRLHRRSTGGEPASKALPASDALPQPAGAELAPPATPPPSAPVRPPTAPTPLPTPVAAAPTPGPSRPTPAAPAQRWPTPPPAPPGLFVSVRPSDTLSRIARDFGLTAAALVEANPQIARPEQIRPGQRIRIPGLVLEPYAVRVDETLASIAGDRGVPLAGLLRLNPGLADPRRVVLGQSIVIPGPERRSYIVQPGETLFSIARTRKMPLSELLRINPQIENGDQVLAGQAIWVPAAELAWPQGT